MNSFRYVAISIIDALFRLFPHKSKTGCIRIGNPDKDSPVFLTCNYRLTVEKVKRTLKGMDAYLLIANSRGINVWCAATGGLFTNHDVISVLKTSGIEDLVEHSTVILPQLAAAGIEARAVQRKTGWRVVWGPVYAKDIPLFMENAPAKTPEMREVAFPLPQRIEMAVAWAFPVSILLSIIMIPFWRTISFPLILLVWCLSLLIFFSFPLYGGWMGSGKGAKSITFERGWLQLVLWGIVLAALFIIGLTSGELGWSFLLRWGVISLVIIVILSFDLMGSTPVLKSGLHGDRLLRVVLDEEKCKGAALCEQVCPRNCYVVDAEQGVATVPGAQRCVQCGACIIQCPFDALYFKGPEGDRILPDTIRKFKLNLMGKRVVGRNEE